MKRSVTRAAAFGISGTVIAGLAVATGAGAAFAAPNQYAPSIGTAAAVPATGKTNVPFNIKASQLCPATDTVVNAFVDSTAAGLSQTVLIGGRDTGLNNLASSGIPADYTLTLMAQNAGKTLVNGTYDLSVVCYPDNFGSAADAQFDGTFTVTGGVGTGAGTDYAFSVPAAPASTTTLAVSPATQANQGASVTLTANVTSSATVAGTVQFKSNGTNVGSPVTVSGGAASLTTTALPAGNQTLTADFIPTNPSAIAPSSSTGVSYKIVAPALATTTTLVASPTSLTTADVLTLSATVAATGSSSIPAGTVTFKEGATTVGTAAVNGSGVAAASISSLTAGSHSYTASFAPTDPAAFVASTSAAASATVTQFAGVQAAENLTTSVATGTLTMTAGGTVNLGALSLTPDNTRFATPGTAHLNPVTVTDQRAGSQGWTVNGQVSDFSDGGANQINSGNLGWTPAVTSTGTGQTVTAGPAVPVPGAPIAPGATTTSGLKVARVLASSPAGASVGTAVLDSTLALIAPTTTKPGTYNATLTLTAL